MPPQGITGQGTCEQAKQKPIYTNLSIREVKNGFIVSKRFEEDIIATNIDEVILFVKENLQKVEE